LLQRCLAGFPVGEGNESESALAAGFAIDRIEEVGERFPRGEHVAEFDLGGLVGDVSNVEFHGLLTGFAWVAV
jgi:hypothetical protein